MLGRILRFFRGDDHPQRSGRPLKGGGAAKLGLALSSGGARGLAHVGVLQVLEENDIEIHCIAGASMGAYVGALWAAGFSGKELEKLAEEMHDRRQLWKLADPIIPPMRGLFRGLKAKAHLERSLGDLRFEDLERRFLVITVDIDTQAAFDAAFPGEGYLRIGSDPEAIPRGMRDVRVHIYAMGSIGRTQSV